MALTDLDQNSRFEKSLGLLTTRFVNLLQEAEDGVLDLKVVCDKMLSIYIENYQNVPHHRIHTCEFQAYLRLFHRCVNFLDLKRCVPLFPFPMW